MTLLERLKQLNAERTQGPWVNDTWSGQCHLKHQHGNGDCKFDLFLTGSHHCISVNDPKRPYAVVVSTDEYGELDEKDGAFIAELSNSADALIEVVELSQKVIGLSCKNARYAHEGCHGCALAKALQPFLEEK